MTFGINIPDFKKNLFLMNILIVLNKINITFEWIFWIFTKFNNFLNKYFGFSLPASKKVVAKCLKLTCQVFFCPLPLLCF